MIVIDTNVLVRVVVKDEEQPEQTQQAQTLVKKAGTVFLPQMVQIELVWVLQAAYKFSKSEVVSVLKYLQQSDHYQLQRETVFSDALRGFEAGNADFSDNLIAVESRSEQLGLWTFDRKLSKQEGVIRLTEKALADF